MTLRLKSPIPRWSSMPIPRGRGNWKYRGLVGAEEARAEWFENFDEVRWEVERVAEANDRVVMLFRLRGKIKGTASDSLEMSFGGVFSFREGKVVEVRFFFSQDAALEAAGLSG